MGAPTIFNSQQLLFGVAAQIRGVQQMPVPEEFYEHGWTVIEGGADAQEAIATQECFIRSIDTERVPLHARLADKIQLAKADRIPICDDIVATSFQVLHFDMGQPFLEGEDQLLVTYVGIYLPKATRHAVTARTRLVELHGLLGHSNLSAQQIEARIKEYVRQHGDGWMADGAFHNTRRLACFIRFLDATSDEPSLQNEIDKTVGQWFGNDQKIDERSAYDQELEFYRQHGIDLEKIEHQIALEPGQLLILDNARVIHGRIGKRKAKELYNFMFGIEKIAGTDIAALRRSICELVVVPKTARIDT